MTAAQQAELASVLAGIEEMKIRSNSRCIPYFSCMSMLPSGELTNSNGKSPFLMGKSTINGHFPLLC